MKKKETRQRKYFLKDVGHVVTLKCPLHGGGGRVCAHFEASCPIAPGHQTHVLSSMDSH